jgi:hypothetical protein
MRHRVLTVPAACNAFMPTPEFIGAKNRFEKKKLQAIKILKYLGF